MDIPPEPTYSPTPHRQHLVPITTQMERPLNYRDRTLHKLPHDGGQLQNKLIQIDKFCEIQQMQINKSKSKTAVFNTATSRDFYPHMVNKDGTPYENVETFKLLGVDFIYHQKSGLKWYDYILNCVKKAHNKMWILRRLAEKGVSPEDILLTYNSRVRIQLEMNIPLWHFTISQTLSKIIEKHVCS